jgi:hypothetical protein
MNAQNENLESMLSEWLCQERATDILGDGPITKAKVNYSVICLMTENIQCSRHSTLLHTYINVGSIQCYICQASLIQVNTFILTMYVHTKIMVGTCRHTANN